MYWKRKILLILCRSLHSNIEGYTRCGTMKLSSRNIALVAVFAALYYVLSLISPYVPAAGLPDLKIRLEALMASVFGFVLGPYLGALAAFTGAFVTWTLPPSSANPLDAPFLLSPPINALVVGFIFYRRWKWAFAAFGLLILAFPFFPPSQPITEHYIVPVAVLWDKIIALLLILPSVWLANRGFSQRYAPILFSILIFLIAFVGNQADNMWGADVFAVPFVYEVVYAPVLSPLKAAFRFETYVEVVRYLFTISPFIYPAIRFVQAILATIITVPLLKALKGTQWLIGERSIIETKVEKTDLGENR